MANRNLQVEQEALKEFGKVFGRMPSSDADWSELHKIAYPTGVPAELQQATNQPAQNVAETAAPGSLGALKLEQQAALDDIKKWGSPTQMVNNIKNKLKAKQFGEKAIAQASASPVTGPRTPGAAINKLQMGTANIQGAAKTLSALFANTAALHKEQGEALEFNYNIATNNYNAAVQSQAQARSEIRDLYFDDDFMIGASELPPEASQYMTQEEMNAWKIVSEQKKKEFALSNRKRSSSGSSSSVVPGLVPGLTKEQNVALNQFLSAIPEYGSRENALVGLAEDSFVIENTVGLEGLKVISDAIDAQYPGEISQEDQKAEDNKNFFSKIFNPDPIGPIEKGDPLITEETPGKILDFIVNKQKETDKKREEQKTQREFIPTGRFDKLGNPVMRKNPLFIE